MSNGMGYFLKKGKNSKLKIYLFIYFKLKMRLHKRQTTLKDTGSRTIIETTPERRFFAPQIMPRWRLKERKADDAYSGALKQSSPFAKTMPKKGVVGNAERGLPQDSYREEK